MQSGSQGELGNNTAPITRPSNDTPDPSSEDPNPNDTKPLEDPKRPTSGPTVRLQGRFDTTDPNVDALFAWPASTMITRVLGTGLAIKLRDVGTYRYGGKVVHNWYNVYVDDELHGKFAMNANDTEYVVAQGLPEGDHIVRVVRRTEPQIGMSAFGGFAALGNGTLLPAPLPAVRQIEFIGDSITAGFGADGNVTSGSATSPSGCPFSDATENADATYASMTAANLDAEFIAIAYSGKGMVQNNDCVGDKFNTMPVLYDTIVPLHDPNRWNFASWTPQVVVINLGTNDYSGANRGCPPPSNTATINGWIAFLRTVRSNYPEATIFCTIGPDLGPPPLPVIQTNIQAAVTMMKDPNIVYYELEQATGKEGWGCAGHPNKNIYTIMAGVTTDVIKRRMGW